MGIVGNQDGASARPTLASFVPRDLRPPQWTSPPGSEYDLVFPMCSIRHVLSWAASGSGSGLLGTPQGWLGIAQTRVFRGETGGDVMLPLFVPVCCVMGFCLAGLD